MVTASIPGNVTKKVKLLPRPSFSILYARNKIKKIKRGAGCPRLGKTTLGAKMKEISLHAKLSKKIYTKHSVQATSVTILDECGFEARYIMCVSGHHLNESSIRSYASKTDPVKHAMSGRDVIIN